jgi:acyl dehydratase
MKREMSTTQGMKWRDVESAVREYQRRIGEVIGVSKEYVIDQKMNDIFGTVIENPDPMHNDPDWAAQSPLGGTVVYGFLQLALTTVIWKDLGLPLVTSDEAYALNYGVDRVRFPSSLRVGTPAQATVRLLDITRRGEDQVLWRCEMTLQQQGNEKPSMVAEIIIDLVHYGSPSTPAM